MTKAKEEKQAQPLYNRTAFIEGYEGQDQLILRVILEDGKSYSKQDVTEQLAAWKKQTINATEEEVKS